MRKLVAVAAAAATMILGSASPSQAVAVGFAPANQTKTVGQSVSVNIVISGLGVAGALGLGAFDFDVVLSNPAIVSFNSYALGTNLGTVGTESDDFSGGFNGTNTIHLAHLSYLTSPQLLALQASSGGTFTLATLSFQAATIGTTFLNITNAVLSDENGAAGGITATYSQGQINVVGPTQVPEPATLLILGVGLALLAHSLKKPLSRRR